MPDSFAASATDPRRRPLDDPLSGGAVAPGVVRAWSGGSRPRRRRPGPVIVAASEAVALLARCGSEPDRRVGAIALRRMENCYAVAVEVAESAHVNSPLALSVKTLPARQMAAMSCELRSSSRSGRGLASRRTARRAAPGISRP